MTSETLHLPASVSEYELLIHIHRLNADAAVDGVLVQLPVPAHISERRVCNAVTPQKDVDGFHTANIGRLCVDQRAIVSATPAAVLEIIKRTGSFLHSFPCILAVFVIITGYDPTFVCYYYCYTRIKASFQDSLSQLETARADASDIWKQEAQLMLTTGSMRLAVSRGQQT